MSAKPNARSHPQNFHTARRRRQEAKDCKIASPRCRPGMRSPPSPPRGPFVGAGLVPARLTEPQRPDRAATRAAPTAAAIVLAARFLFAPELSRGFHEQASPKREAERRKAHTEAAMAQQAERRLRCAVAARAAFGGRARLSALYRGSRRGFFPLAQSGPALHGLGTLAHPSPRAASSWQTGFRQPGEFPNRPEWSHEPHPGHRSRSHQTAVTG